MTSQGKRHLTKHLCNACSWIAECVLDGRFQILGGGKNMFIAWRLTNDKNDPFSKKNYLYALFKGIVQLVSTEQEKY